MQPLLVITGPTACGKSELALRLAEGLGGEIVNLDSMQLFRGFDIGTAKPSIEQRQRVAHHLFDIRDPGDESNVARYIEDARKVVLELQFRGRLCVFAGGSTLYLTCLLHGLAALPGGKAEIRSELEARSSEDLYAELLRVDPDISLSIRPGDRLRIVRALETWQLSGSKPSLALRAHGHKEQRFTAIVIVLCRTRAELYARINERACAMLRDGLVQETKCLAAKYGTGLFQFRSLGYAQVLKHLRADLPLENLAEEIAMQTRRFAKRQMTYFRNEPAKRGWKVLPGASEGRLLEPAPVRGPAAKAKSFRVLECTFADLQQRLQRRLAEPFSVNEIWFVAAAGL